MAGEPERYDKMNDKLRKDVLRFAQFRMLVGALTGFALFFLISMLLFYINGWLEGDIAINPYLGPPPMMTAGLFGFFGSVVGALLGLFSKR